MNDRSQDEYLFVYGSLLTGTPNRRLNKLLIRPLRRSRPAVIQARLYHLGRYPGAVASGVKTDRVYGRLLRIRDPRLLRFIDRYEDCYSGDPRGEEFLRSAVLARLPPSLKTVRCWAYLYNRGIAGRRRIRGGDYLKDTARRRNKWRTD